MDYKRTFGKILALKNSTSYLGKEKVKGNYWHRNPLTHGKNPATSAW